MGLKYGGIFLGILMVIMAFLYLGVTNSDRWENGHGEERIAAIVKEAFELANPGAIVSDVTLIDDDGVYRAIFRVGDDLMEVFVDKSGKYIFTTRTETNSTITSYRSQKQFFECLRDRGTILYGLSTTNATIRQLSLFSNSPYLGYVYIDCSGDGMAVCVENNVTSVPSWGVGGNMYEGVATILWIENMTGCYLQQ